MQKIVFFLVIFFSLLNVQAGHTEYNIRKNRSEINVSVDPVIMTVSYPNFSAYGTPDELRHQGKVRLEYDRENQSDITWDYFWRYSAVFEYQEGGTQTCTLSVSYENGNYIYSDYKLFLANASLDDRTIEITTVIGQYYNGSTWVTVANPHSDSHIPTDIHLELAIITDRYYELDETKPIFLSYAESVNEVRWHYFQGAESYDLEWVFIDSASMEYQVVMDSIDAGMATYGDTTDFEDFYSASLPFRLKEPTRVNVKGTRYTVDMIYPAGAIFFRVRPVGVYTGADNPSDDYETVKTGKWSYYVTTGDIVHQNHEALAWHEINYTNAFAADQNWLYGISFAEDGKSVSSLSYYDGSLRGRQSLVYNTSDDITLVGESKFDYEGRQTVSIIPAPLEGRNFAYQENFNQNTSGTPFEKENFDKTNPEALKTNPTGGTKGSAQYFSTNNTFTNDQYRAAIPVADGYVYAQVKFNKDATGRISEVAGIGETFAMGNGHTTRYYYTNVSDFELRRLFGDEVGYADNYKKTYVVDANGQTYVSYTDNHGRVIATALSGSAPVNLIELDDSDAETVTMPLSVDNAVSTAYEKKSRVTFYNSGSTDYEFTYNINGVLYGVENPSDSAETLCAKCAYTLYFHIEDPDGDTVVASFDTWNFSASGSDVCSGTGVTYYTPDSANLNLGFYTLSDTGEYTVIKRLIVDYDAIVDSVYAAADNMLGGFENFADSILSNVDISGCFNDCDSYCEYKMMQTVNLTGDWDALTQTQKDSAIAECMNTDCNLNELWYGDDEDQFFSDSLGEDVILGAMNECEGIRQMMIQQLSPGGLVYQDLGDPASEGSIFWSWDNVEGDLGNGPGDLTLYTAYNDDCTPASGATHITVPATLQNPANFQPCWIDDLLPYHREYCHYETCVALAETINADTVNSKQFDLMMASYGPWPGNPDINDYVNTTLAIDPLNNSNIEVAVNLRMGLDWLDMITGMTDSVCGVTGGMDIDTYIDSLWICINGNGALSAQDSIDKWTLFVGKYQDKKNLYINYYKDHLDSIGTYERGCLYYDDADAIVLNPVIESDSLAGQESFTNTLSSLEAQVGTILSFNCADQCDNNVAFWMAGFPDTCQQTLAANSNELYDELELLFQDYCNASCQNGNVFGWFYNNESPQFDSIVSFFTTNNLQCGLESIQIDTAYLDFDSVVTVNLLTPCFLELSEFVMVNMPTDFVSDTVSSVTLLHECLGDSTYTYIIKVGFGNDSNQIYVAPAVDCDQILMELFDLNNNPINFDPINGFGNFSASQIHDSIVFVDVYFDDDTITGKFIVAKCLESEPENVLMYTPPAIPNPVIDCIDEAYASAMFEAEQLYSNLLTDLANALLDSIDCMTDVVEIYKVEKEIREYQYTLYYYDLVGNLTTTVPPLGVHPLSQGEFDAAYDDQTHEWATGNNPDHDLQTLYTYNGANQLTQQTTPDGGTTNYYYDDLFRLRFSQNAQQLIDDKFSYTIYDELGRAIEAGEAGDPAITPLDFESYLNDYTFPNAVFKRDYMKTYYEEGYTMTSALTNLFTDGKQKNLRNKIGAVEQRTAHYTNVSGHVVATDGTEVKLYTSYSYDFHGNVDELVQTNTHLAELGHQYKKMEYDYDLISGNVRKVVYQKDSADEWQHKYHYDANNRLVRTWTSDDGEEWELDAKYFYYLHGSLARVETGHDKVQGTDYAFNMQGWLKGVNSTTLQASRDMGGDANSTGLDKFSGADVYGYSLGYFEDDYTPISGSAFANADALISANGAYGNLYNGNISHMVTAMKDDDEAMIDVLGSIYSYDQLQRIKSSDNYWVSNQSTYVSSNSFSGAVNYNSDGYAEKYWFDKNGNLDSLTRKNSAGTFYDNFSYNYHANQKNRLMSVDDNVGNNTVMTDDVDDQNTNNYTYNAIGQLISDSQENIANIEWTVTGKERKISIVGANDVEFVYDALGNRVMKIEMGINDEGALYTYYVYDASGNIMSTYSRAVTLDSWDGGNKIIADNFKLQDRLIYGSKRIGVKNENRTLTDRKFKIPGTEGYTFYHTILEEVSLINYPDNFEKEKRKIGEKYYEFSEHRGNVLEVTTDQKIRNIGETRYEANIISYQDFSPFGTTLDGRSGNTPIYAFGFQGQLSDSEIKGEGNSINYKYRMHDPRIGRFFAVDPLAPKYPFYSPYSFSGNRLIDAVELEGLEPKTENGSSGAVPNFIPAPTYNIDHNSDFGSTLAEGDPVQVANGCVYINHCGVVDSYGQVQGEGLYQVEDYVNNAVEPTGNINRNEGYGAYIETLRLKTVEHHFFGGYSGIDSKNNGISPYLEDIIAPKWMGPQQPVAYLSDDTPMIVNAIAIAGPIYGLAKYGVSKAIGTAAFRKTTTTEIVLMSEDLLTQALTKEALTGTGVEVIGNYTITGTRGLVGTSYNVNVFHIITPNKSFGGAVHLIKYWESEAIKSGAQQISIYGSSVYNTGLLTAGEAFWKRFGYTYEASGSGFYLTKSL